MRPALSSRATRLGSAFDLLAEFRPGDGFFFERDGLGVATAGVAARVRETGGDGRIERLASAALEVLGAIEREGHELEPPVAVGAISFDEAWPADLVVPARTAIRRRSAETRLVDVVAKGLPPLDAERAHWTGRALPHDAFDEFQLRPRPDPSEYAAAVRNAVRRIRGGELRKVVLARSIELWAGRELDAKQLLWRLRAVDPDCWVFAAPQHAIRPEDPATGALVGATPELLVRKDGAVIEADPLAGSAPRFGDPDEDRASGERLLASAKDQEEHAAVREAVAATLEPLCEELSYPGEPVLLGTANIWHLATPFRGRLWKGVRSVLEVVAALHPTPAVCGTPRSVARRLIAELEPFDRGCYAGPVGWVDANGDGEWAIALRCAEITGERARLFAGAGIVADSVPELEVDETERKFRAFLDSLRWG